MQEKHTRLNKSQPSSRTQNPGALGKISKGGEKISKGGRGGRSANDQRSDSMNPNNASCQASTDNRSNQLNSNNSEYKGDEEDDE